MITGVFSVQMNSFTKLVKCGKVKEMDTILSNDHAVAMFAKELNDGLVKGEVLLFLSGGSTIPIGVDALHNIPANIAPRLHIALADERYGAYLHADSNWKGLLDAGLSEDQGFVLHPVITSSALPIKETSVAYEAVLLELFEKISTVIALFGIGEDDHIAGILPDSPAAHETKRFVIDYDAGKFQRITIAPPVFPYITTAMISAKGEKKRESIARLSESLDSIMHPDQLVHQCAKTTIFYSLL